MTSYLRSFLWVLAAAALAAAAPSRSDPAASGRWPLRDVRIPFELYEDGRVKTEIEAEGATLPVGGRTQATGVCVRAYDRSGAVTGRVEADHCLYDEAGRRVTSDGAVDVQTESLTISGTGFEWEAEEGIVRILHNVEVVFHGGAMPVLGLGDAR